MKRTVHLAAHAVLGPGGTPEISFVPPLVRRRFSPLQKLYFALAKAAEKSPAANTVFSSRDGEDTLTRRLVEEFHADGTVSPHRFSSSVYNAAPGLWSVFTGNRASYTAVAAGDDSVESGLLEALAGAMPSLYVYAEETGGGYGAAMFFEDVPGARALDAVEGDPARGAMTYEALAAFLEGRTHVLEGRWVTLRDRPCAG